MRCFIALCFTFFAIQSFAQELDSVKIQKDILDSIFIAETENIKNKSLKILHAEPLYIDLIRDLGARKGEKEWNVAFGLADNNRFDKYTALIEYEFAPINRLGLEIEVPFTFYYPLFSEMSRDSVPKSKLNSLKLAAQYTFWVSDRYNTSLALGYIHEFELPNFSQYGKMPIWKGNIFNPFLVAAKRWRDNWHTLIYSGPVIERHFKNLGRGVVWQHHTNIHYMISGTRNFIGVELNKEISQKKMDMTIRPQMRVGLADNLIVGIVTGVPINRNQERFSTFIRLIYEPGHKHGATKVTAKRAII